MDCFYCFWPACLTVCFFTVFLDWYCVVDSPLRFGTLLTEISDENRPQLCKNIAGQEIDWSISAIFGKTDSIPSSSSTPSMLENRIFSGYVYAIMLVQVCIILTYFCFIFSLAISIYRLNRGEFGIWVVPNLRSNDTLKRMGFENFERVLQPCVFVTILSFIMAFAMRIQNEFLRSSDENIFIFMFGYISDLFSGEGFSIPKAMGEIFDIGMFEDPNSLVAAPTILVLFTLVSVILGLILRRAALDSASYVERALQDKEEERKVNRFYGTETVTLRNALNEIKVWPLSWPEMRTMLFLAAIGVVCFFFYRLAFIWIALVLYRVLMKLYKGQEIL
jgi:hypothetical protein